MQFGSEASYIPGYFFVTESIFANTERNRMLQIVGKWIYKGECLQLAIISTKLFEVERNRGSEPLQTEANAFVFAVLAFPLPHWSLLSHLGDGRHGWTKSTLRYLLLPVLAAESN